MTPELTERAERAIADFESAGDFLRSPFFQAMVNRALEAAVTAAASPMVDRVGAAAFCRCSVSEIDRAARAGIIKRYERCGTPIFLKEELQKAITSGKWKR